MGRRASPHHHREIVAILCAGHPRPVAVVRGAVRIVIRRNRLVSLHKLLRLRKRRHAGGVLEAWLVEAGTGVSAPRQTLRYLRRRCGGTRYGNSHAVAMQVYAASLVYNTMRAAQGEVAAAAGIAPEEIPPAKFYPKLAAACHAY